MPSKEFLWPPDRRFRSVQILGVTGPGWPSIVIDSIYQDKPVGIRRDGRGIDTDVALLRAQRWPGWLGGNGRVYHIGFTADDGRGGSCSGEVKVEVRVRNNPAIDDEPDFDSTVPSPWGWWRQ